MNKSFQRGRILALMLFLIGCGDGTANHDKGMKDQKLIVINVLDENLYKDVHIKGSINVPFDQVEEWAATIKSSIPVVTYCANYACTASGEAARQLLEQGFTNVRAYEGGMAEWYQLHQQSAPDEYPLVGIAQAKYLQESNEPLSEEPEVPVISAQQLQQEMRDAALFS